MKTIRITLGASVALVGALAAMSCASDSDSPTASTFEPAEPANEMPANEMPANEMPANEMPANEMPAGNTAEASVSTSVNEDGDVLAVLEEYGIEGSFQAINSPMGSNIEINADLSTDGNICVTGNIAEVPNGDYDNFWGAELILTLKPEGAAWPSNDVVGFSFTITSNVDDLPLPSIMRFKGVATSDAMGQYCWSYSPLDGAPIEGSFESVTKECWNAGGDPIDAENLNNISWQLNSDPGVNYPFDFCISDITPVLGG